MKGAFLEFIVRNILKSCGFSNVIADKLYTFENKGLFFINGKGAAHDADVIMDPPIQIPFSYPMRIIFECKSYDMTVGLPVVRNAAGLRDDINNFEIVTKDFLLERKKNRTKYAVENRSRHLYQVGVVSLDKFSAAATEFAIHNKIPLLSLSSNFNRYIADQINSISQENINECSAQSIANLFKYLKDREGNLFTSTYEEARNLLYENGNVFQNIHTLSTYVIKKTNVGLLENGQVIFLFKESEGEEDIFNSNYNSRLTAQLHWKRDSKDIWELDVLAEGNPDYRTRYRFFLPKEILREWGEFSNSKNSALELKNQFFSKIMVFNKGNHYSFPLSIVNLDEEWLNRLRAELRNNSENEPN